MFRLILSFCLVLGTLAISQRAKIAQDTPISSMRPLNDASSRRGRMRNDAYSIAILGQAKDRRPKRFFGRFEYAQTVNADMSNYSSVRFMYLMKYLDRAVDYELSIINDADYELLECESSAGAVVVDTQTVTTGARGDAFADAYLTDVELFTDYQEAVDDNRISINGMILQLSKVGGTDTDLLACGIIQ